MTTPDMNTAEAEGWRPADGDMLVGTVEDVDVGWSDFRGEYPIITITAGEGTKSANVKPGESVKVHCFHDVLFNRVLTLRPVPGETVGIQFHGQTPHKTKPSQTVSKYTFKVAGRGANVGGLYDRMGNGRQARPTPQPQPRGGLGERPPADTSDFEPAQQSMGANEDDDIPF